MSFDDWKLALHVLSAFALGKGTRLLKVTLALSLILLAAYLVAVWAMAGKPD